MILWTLTLLMALGVPAAAQTPAKGEQLAELDGEAIAAEARVTGTPGFFIKNRLVSGAQSRERFVRVIREERAR
jgi:predicted DsbA family dithiol-disulfide isomerase